MGRFTQGLRDDTLLGDLSSLSKKIVVKMRANKESYFLLKLKFILRKVKYLLMKTGISLLKYN